MGEANRDKSVKRSKGVKGSKADNYLFHGKTFSLDNFANMIRNDPGPTVKSCLGRRPPSLLMREEEPETRGPANL